jgi:hypothetical protein
MFITALFTIGKLWNWPRCPRANEWMKKMWYIYSKECYSYTMRNEILLFAGNWME